MVVEKETRNLGAKTESKWELEICYYYWNCFVLSHKDFAILLQIRTENKDRHLFFYLIVKTQKENCTYFAKTKPNY